MAIELISTVRPKGENSKFPIVLSNEIQGGIHYVETQRERDNIPDERKQIGMLCYVSSASFYFMYLGKDSLGKDNWQPFSPAPDFEMHHHENREVLDQITQDVFDYWTNKPDTLVDTTYQRIFRVDNDDEVDQIINTYGDAVATGSMAFVKNTRNTYLFLGDEWANINTFGTNIHIGDTPPEDITMVWIDTSDDNVTDEVILGSETNNAMIKAILESIKSLREDVDVIKAIIKNGNIEWPDDDENDTPIESVIKLILEDGDFFITEDGEYIIDETIEYIEPEKPSTTKKDVILLENGDFFITENGDFIVDENSSGNDEENSEPSQTLINKVIGENGDTLITEFGEYIIQEI